jgi:pentatricopeptide repeat protein
MVVIISGMCSLDVILNILTIWMYFCDHSLVLYIWFLSITRFDYSLCKDKFVNDAYELYSEMIAKKISPDVFTFNALIWILHCWSIERSIWFVP